MSKHIFSVLLIVFLQSLIYRSGDTMSKACKSMSLRFKIDLRLLVWKDDAAIFDGGTGEVARKATQSKLFSDRLKSVLVAKCHLNDFLNSATYLDKSTAAGVEFPIVQMIGLDAHLCTLRLDSKKSYVLEEVCAFPFPVSLLGIRSGGIEDLINGLLRIESFVGAGKDIQWSRSESNYQRCEFMLLKYKRQKCIVGNARLY
ncbi:hypothetical protein V8B55DRAFT_1390105 [Mucor lusitanicus]